MQKSVTERLQIKNFFSIVDFDWEIREFNVLTGGMASGKSLCIKLAYFFESILNEVISFATWDTFTKKNFYDKIAEKFNIIFHSLNTENDFCKTTLNYIFKVEEQIFDLSLAWNKKDKKLKWESKYIDNHIDNVWNKTINNNSDEIDISGVIRSILYEFSEYFPITATFVPATRAIASVIKEVKSKKKDKKNTAGIFINDPFLNDFIYNNKFFNAIFKSFDKNILSDIKELLHLDNMRVNTDPDTLESTILSETPDKRTITQLEMSSGQQELVYLLLTIHNLFGVRYYYESDAIRFFSFSNVSVFLEEPSTHLFPQEQKTTIEFIVRNYRILKEEKGKSTRFFITTHSPYTLNVINNMLLKGNIIKSNPKQLEKINKKIKFPHLFKDETTAVFINNKEKRDKTKKQCRDMIDKERGLIFAGEIADISYGINKDTNDLEDIRNELTDHKEKNYAL